MDLPVIVLDTRNAMIKDVSFLTKSYEDPAGTLTILGKQPLSFPTLFITSNCNTFQNVAYLTPVIAKEINSYQMIIIRIHYSPLLLLVRNHAHNLITFTTFFLRHKKSQFSRSVSHSPTHLSALPLSLGPLGWSRKLSSSGSPMFL